MHQLAMYLRRGVLKPLIDKEDGAVDRALFGMVNRMHEKVEAHATHDELTGFMNRKSFMQAIERHLPEGGKKDRGAVLCQLALVNLESINDEHGVAAGDELLQTVAKFIKDRIGEKRASFGRLGAGELGIYWQKGGLQSAYKKLQQCIDALGEHGIERDEEKIIAEVRAGITGVQDGMTQPDQLMTIVAEACVVAMSGSDKPIYVAGAENRYREQIEQMVSYIGRAIDRERLALLLLQVHALSNNDAQPAAHIAVTAEDRNGKLIPPAMFTQAMNNSERAFEVDEWVLKQTLAWMATLGDSLDDYAAVIIPLSQAAVRRDDLANVIVNELMQSTVPPGKICFEIADKNAIENVTETTELVRTLKEFGCKFILDEFGGGQTNYDYVKELAVDFVTIQSTYIAEAKANTKDFAMAKSINELAHFMGKLTIAKQDGTGDLGDILREIGVDFLYDLTKTSRIAA
jgi:diguanylate cyclase (GGDEF)-like protein